ncbi:MAG: cyclase family protein [Acidimicrobiia bacterium]
MTAPEVLDLHRSLSNWGRWGDDDERGTLNLVTPELVHEALAAVTGAASVSCSRVLRAGPGTVPGGEFLHFMLRTGDQAPEEGGWTARDWIGVGCHGFDHTHLDSHSHVIWDRSLYNGRPASAVTVDGAAAGGVEPAFDGLVSRGVLLDLPPVRGTAWVAQDEPVTPADLDEAERRAGTTVAPGTFLWLRLGRGEMDAAGHVVGQAWSPGLHPSCLPWLAERGVALLGTDVTADVFPTPWSVPPPVHLVGIHAMGLWLVDNADLERLARECAARHRYEFASVVSPLALDRATGSLVNPLALF